MGRILAGVLFLAACVGDRPAGAPPDQGGVDPTGPTSVTRLAPQVCDDMTWHTGIGGAVDFAAIGRGQSMQLLSVPLAGGAVSAYAFGKAGNTETVKPSLEMGAGITSVSSSLVGNYLVGTSGDASSLHITALSLDLSAALPLANVAPGLVGKSALQTAGGTIMLPVADDQGLRIEAFDPRWNATTIRVATTDPALAMTAAQMQDATVAAWSTVDTCYAMTLTTAAPGRMIAMPGACLAPSLAIEPVSELGVLLFEGTDGIRMTEWEHQNIVGVSQLIAQGGSSPRALFDGTRMWMSLLDDNGNIVIGYRESGHFISTTLATRPMAAAYDLVMMDGSVWAVSNTDETYKAQRICLAPTTTTL